MPSGRGVCNSRYLGATPRDQGVRSAGPPVNIRRWPSPLHLTAAMQVVRTHQRRRHITVDDARRAIQDAADAIANGIAGPESSGLAAKLEKMTGCSIAELAKIAEKWPADIG